MIRRFKLGRDVELHKRTLRARAAVRRRAPTRAGVPGAADLPEAEHAHGSARSAARRCGSWSPTAASTCSATPSDADAVRAALVERRRRAGRPRRPPRSCGSSPAARASASTSTPESVIPQEAGLNERAVSFTKGCYVGQETVARLLLPRQAEPPPARAAPVGARRAGRRAAARRARGRHGRRAPSSPRRSGPIALALVRREAEPGATSRAAAAGDPGTTA